MAEQEDLNAPSDMKEQIDEKQGSILMGIIKQLRIGMDLSRVTLPTFILEPRSFLERMSDFMIHNDLLMGASLIDDPIERFTAVLQWYLAGWHHKPKGVKKPYNPILGEEFNAKWDTDNGELTLIAEQVTHHPPVSAVYFENKPANFIMNGHIYTKSKFLGNSAACILDGQMQMYFTNRPGEEYIITVPTAYVRGIFFGTLIMELGDKVTITCKKTNMIAELEFRTKGFFSGDYNEIRGTIKSNGKAVYSISGKWDSIIKKTDAGSKDGQVFVDVSQLKPTKPMQVAPIEEQKEFESRRLWDECTKAMLNRDYETATVHKTRLEDEQRQRAKELAARGETHKPQYFVLDDQQRWRYKGLSL